ncbi:MAG: CPBP family intramembrane glutamic endopeptidase [Actinomycetota bacterium]
MSDAVGVAWHADLNEAPVGASSQGRDLPLAGGLGGAYGAFAAAFRGPRERFWQRMTATGAALGALALVAEPSLRRTRVRPRDVALGLTAAAGLYAVFRIGDRMARRIMPSGAEEIDDVYALRSLRPRNEIAARLALVIGPAEELFWRGFVLRRLQHRLGRWRGAAAAAFVYGGAHVVTGNATLVGAATTAGAYWSALASAGMPMGALVVSHVAWDVWIFLLQPTVPPSAEGAPRHESETGSAATTARTSSP